MNEYNARRAYYERRRKRRRRIIIRRVIIFTITLVVTACLISAITAFCHLLNPQKHDEGFIPTPFGKNVSKKVLKAEELQIPEWIDEQIIRKHGSARTGIKLTDIKDIVIHYVGNPNTTAQANRDYFENITTDVSSHFVVGLDGEIIQCIPLYEKSAASNERNKDTISIEVCHPDDRGEFNTSTYNSVIKLVSWLCNEFSLDEKDIIRHYDITGKICPKYYVEHEDEWQKFLDDVEEELNEY